VNNEKQPFSLKEFNSIYSKVPRLTVEIIIPNDKGEIYLTKRAIEPCKGQWHLPGGTVRFGEALQDAVKRITDRELGVAVKQAKNVGYIEYPSHYLHGLDSPVGIAFEVTRYSGEFVLNNEALSAGWFSKMPLPMHADQDEFLLQHGYLSK